jgi:hypothetical protein
MKTTGILRKQVTVSREFLRSYRIWKSMLLEHKPADIESILSQFIALDAGNYTAICIALFNRMRNFTPYLFEEYITHSNQAGLLRGMRRKSYVIPRNLFAVIFSATHRQREHIISELLQRWNISENEYTLTARSILKALSNGEHSREELQKTVPQDALKQKTITYGDKPLTDTLFAFVMDILLTRWQVVLSPQAWIANEERYTTFEQLYPECRFSADFDTAEKELVFNYITDYGPVLDEDIAWWCDLTINRALAILQSLKGEITTIEIDGRCYFISRREKKAFLSYVPAENEYCHLLGKDDSLFMSYSNTDVNVRAKQRSIIFTEFGSSSPAVLINGETIGTWKFKHLPASVDIQVELYNRLTPKREDRLCREIERVGEFLGNEDIITRVSIHYI